MYVKSVDMYLAAVFARKSSMSLTKCSVITVHFSSAIIVFLIASAGG